MSDIQFALTILAVIIILIMIIFNWIRLIQYRKQNQTENSFLSKEECNRPACETDGMCYDTLNGLPPKRVS